MNKSELQLIGNDLIENGLNVIAVDCHKTAIFPWKNFNQEKVSKAMLENQLIHPRAFGIAVICGEVSGGLEVIDFDLKHDISADLMERYNNAIPIELLSKLRIIKTKSGGFHYYYRCEVIEGNKKLASRLSTVEERNITPSLKQLVLIETRGNSGYVVAPPTDGYTIIQSVPIPIINPVERELLLNTARSFNEKQLEIVPRAITNDTMGLKTTLRENSPYAVTPLDDFNNKADVLKLLFDHGWTIVSEDEIRVYVKRPGNSTALNSGNYHKAKRLLFIWSTSTEFVPQQAYNPVAIFTILEHGGNFKAALYELKRRGFGILKECDRDSDRNLKRA